MATASLSVNAYLWHIRKNIKEFGVLNSILFLLIIFLILVKKFQVIMFTRYIDQIVIILASSITNALF